MKKIITYIIVGLTSSVFAQSFSVYKTNNLGANTATITNGYNLSETSSASAVINTKIKIKNNAATTQTFNVIRSTVAQNPTLFLDNSTNTPSSYFCFGYTCFSSGIITAQPNDYTILAASGVTSTTFPYADNTLDNSQPVSIYLEEGANPGYYVIKYKIFNVANSNDTLAFTVTYNQTLGLNELTKKPTSDIFPNPAKEETNLKINMTTGSKATVKVINALGQTIFTKKVEFNDGLNTLQLDTKNYSNGLYDVIIETNTGTLNKKLIISK